MKSLQHTLFVLLLILLTSCGEDRTGEFYALIEDRMWIEEVMRENYLWAEDMPVIEKEDDYFDDDYKAPKAVKPSKVTPMRQPVKRAGSGMEVVVIKPNSVEDAREITETLLNNRAVILNVEGLDVEVAQRIIDFTSGSTFAISGNLQKISNYIFLVTPTNVDISGDLQDLLNTSFDMPSFKTRY